MHIKEIILEGFKSYAHRTVVSGFDPHFNAITGLNGSGKSNILDAILFVLGINNPSQVRVLNWAGLIYKKAQGDIQKASVAIVFDNTDPETSPAGYQNQAEITVTRQIMANGKNKYLINGHNAQVSAVQNLFHSVRLNINNPHFLVMQGMITKVINMKPAEILAMIEEAAGTRMYEEKKQKAFKTIEKKQTKVDEIRRIVADEIAPKLEKLRDEQKNYIQWTSNKKEIERLQRFSIAFSFGDAMKVVESNEVNVAAEVANRDQLLEQQTNLQAEIAAIEKQISALTPEDLEQENQRLRKKVETLSTEYIKITSNLNNIRDNILDEEKQAEAVEAAIAQVLAKVDRKEEKAQSIQKTLQELEVEAAESRAMYENLSRTFQEALTGTKSKDSNAKSWADRVMEAEQELINAQSGLEQERKMTEIRRRQLTQKKKEFGSSVGSNTLQQDFEQAKNEVDQLTQQIQGLQRAKQQFEELKQNKSAIERETGGLNEKWEEINGRLGNFQFQFSDPVKGFDRSKVKGRVGQQVRMKNPSRDALALEVSAGAKIQNLIVDSSETAKLLLERGRLQESVTMIPLNKIQSNPLKDSKVQLAKRLVGADNVDLALNLIDFDAELEPAMRFAFGSTLICKDLDSARAVAFHDEIRCRAVTLQGDVVDPAGTISGGSRKSQVVRLLLIHEHQQIETTLRRNGQQLADIDRELNSLQGHVQEYTRFEQKLLLKQTDLNIIQQRLQSTTYHKLQTEIADLEAALQKSSSTTEQLTARIEAANVNLQALKRDSSSSSSDSSSSIEQLQQQLVKTEALSRKKTDAVKKQNEMLNRVKLETQQLHDEISLNKEKLAQISARIDELQAEELKQNQHFEEFDVSYRAEKDKMEKYTQKINSTRTEITQLNQRKTQTIAQLDRATLELKKVENNLLNLEKNKNDAKLAIDHLLKAHPWISSEADLFGQPGTDYDFSTMTHNQSKRNLEKLRQQQDKLSRSINQKVMNMFEMAEEEYKELKKKEQIILDDKVRIESFINNLEEKKKEALVATWQSVNECFGNIFAKLLPGWSSKLEPPANQTIMDGLEVKFARGGVWKDSLSELSGGQRSLLALSLILAMLRIKPAPVYILDEVDSALDLSNTQNIGLMLKEYFDQSQFLIVSLKDGMWNNANVLFKTKFVDGSSTVTRHAKLAR